MTTHGGTVILLCALMTSGAATPLSPSPILGRVVENISLRNSAGQDVSIVPPGGGKATVVVFVGAECPLVLQYMPRLAEIAQRFEKKGVRIVCIDSNIQDSPTEVAAFVRKSKTTLPVLMDPGGKIADAFGARRTPEAYVLDAQRTIRYHGRIDDQYEVGVHRPRAKSHDVVAALEAVLAGKPIATPETAAVGCIIGRSSRKTIESPTTTYAEHVAPIFKARCVECHRPGEIAPFALTTYDEAKGWAETVAEIVSDRRMPPWFADPKHGEFENETQMSDAERAVIQKWVEEGCAPGDLSKAPALPNFVEGWALGEPDKVYQMSEEFTIPATGVVGYKHYTIDPGFTEDMWVISSEAKPLARSAVHHILVFAVPPGGRIRDEFMEGHLIGAYAPGVPAHALEPGQAVFAPKGTKFVMQMHYTPTGSPQVDRSMLGLRFCRADQVKQRVESGMVINFLLVIPPGHANREIQASYKFAEDRLLLTLTPHMHLRGKAFRYEAVYPDGKREILLDIPRYDFNWQITYRLAKAKLMPKGTKLVCTAAFDNSADNPNNPDPKAWVRFGPQTWDEMLIGWYTVAIPGDPKTDQASIFPPSTR